MLSFQISQKELLAALDAAKSETITPEGLLAVEEIHVGGNEKLIKIVETANKLWDKIISWLLTANRSGAASFNKIKNEIDAEINSAQDYLKEDYSEASLIVRDRLTAFRRKLYEMVLKVFPKLIRKQDYVYHADTINFNFTIKASQDLKISISELATFLIEGNISIQVGYVKISSEASLPR